LFWIIPAQGYRIQTISEDDFSWVGVYSYAVMWESGINDIVRGISHTIEIFERDGNLYADFTIWGWMTETRRSKARVVEFGDLIQIVSIPEHQDPSSPAPYKNEGYVRLTLVRDGSDIITIFGRFEPQEASDLLIGEHFIRIQ